VKPIIPIATTQANIKNGTPKRRVLALCRDRTVGAAPGVHRVGKFGPQVEILSVTAVVPAPVAIDDGLNKQLVNAGRFAQPKFTAEANELAPTGAAENE
jgi:hypothetical protein